jgi:organic radical activating enzyme
MVSSKVFPIKTATACRLKWAWSTLYLNSGQTSSCHRSSHSVIDTNSFDNFHNTDQKLKARQDMLDGAWPGNGCEYCRDIETAGGISDRMFQNQIPDVYPSELNSNLQEVTVNPSILEVFFSNTCNLKCVYCEGSLSSAIQAEDTRFGGSMVKDQRFDSVNHYKELAPKFWSWFEKNSQSLQRLQILGGEPLLQKDFFKILEFIDKHPHSELEFNIVTNLSVSTSIVEKTAELLIELLKNKKLKRVDIQASVDCWGPGQEYVRTGFQSDLFEKNLKTLLDKKVFRIGLLSTVCSLTIPEMNNLVSKHQEWSQHQEIFWYMHLVLPTNSIFSPMIFGSQELATSLEKVYNQLPKSTWDQKQTLDILAGIIKKIKTNAKDNQQVQRELVEYLDTVDQRRGLNWKNTFPWLESELKNVV